MKIYTHSCSSGDMLADILNTIGIFCHWGWGNICNVRECSANIQICNCHPEQLP